MGRLTLALAVLVLARLASGQEEGIQWGSTVWRPDARVNAAYDNRVGEGRNVDGPFFSDTYGEWQVGLSVQNLPAVVNYAAYGRYGWRYYDEFSFQNDDFYNVGGVLSSGDTPLIWSLATDYNKALDYNVGYDPAIGQEPDSILTSERNTRWVTTGSVGYDVGITEITSIRPAYSLQHYYQTFDASGMAEWQIHSADVQLRRKHSERTVFTLAGNYALQVNDDEEGYVGTVTLGVESQSTDKTSWLALIGYSHADYDLSGTDQGFVANIRGNWDTTEKITLYVFGGNDFQPGYDGGAARWVYRLGYGFGWNPVDKISFGASVLHDYQDEIGSSTSTDPALGTVRHFFNASLGYQLLEGLDASLGYRFVNDEYTQNQQVVSAQISYAY